MADVSKVAFASLIGNIRKAPIARVREILWRVCERIDVDSKGTLTYILK